MQQCGSCNRYLMVGEVFRMYRRQWRRRASVVCSGCRDRVEQRGWRPIEGPAWRQLTRRPRVYNKRMVMRTDDLRVEAVSRRKAVTHS
jgi:hypothetical protein